MWVGRRKGQTEVRGAKKQRGADSIKIGVKGAKVQKEQNRKGNHRESLLELLFEQRKCYEMLNMLKVWTIGMSSGITLS